MPMCMNTWQCLCVRAFICCVSEAYEEVVVPVFQKMKHGIGRKRENCTAPFKFHTVTAICGVTFFKNAVHCETVMHGITNLMETWYVHYCLVNTKGLFRDLLEWCWCAWLDVRVVRQCRVHGKGGDRRLSEERDDLRSVFLPKVLTHFLVWVPWHSSSCA